MEKGSTMKSTVESWGKMNNGTEVHRIRLENNNGMSVSVLNYGGIIQSLCVPDRNGVLEDVVLGYDSLEEYIADDCYFGALVGRVANRIAGASFELNGKNYRLSANEGDNTLHGGSGFHKKLWDFEVNEETLLLKRESPDGEDGFPGNLKSEIRFTLSEENVLRLDFSAVSDQTTLCSLTSHSYFNLHGVSNAVQSISDHQLQIGAMEYTPAGEDLLPTGEICSVQGTKYNFIGARTIGEEELDGNLVLTHANKNWDARMLDPESGRVMILKTSLPGLQIYNGTGITKRSGKGGTVYGPQSGLAIEPQFFPDAIHHPEFPQPVLKSGEEYSHYIEYRFGVV